MPQVRSNEKRSEFVKRCVPIVMKEGLSQQAAVGKCEGIYSGKKRKGIAKAMKA